MGILAKLIGFLNSCLKDNKKLIIAMVIVIVALSIMINLNLTDNSDVMDKSGERLSFNVSSGNTQLSRFVNDTMLGPKYSGCDVETIKWMESLGNKSVFFGNDQIVIMSIEDAEKIPKDPGITDVYIYNHFEGDVIENHDLGNKYPAVFYVENVTFVTQEIIGTGLA